jgi:ribosomal protein S18 acetylase RimI-like enzyme
VESLASYATRAGADPAQLLGAMLDEVLGGSWMYSSHGRRGALARLERQGAGAERVLIATDDLGERPAGFLEWSMPPRTTAAFVDDVGVLRPARGQGWGKRLVGAALAAMRVAGATTVGLDVDKTNAAALGLYGAFGFVETGCVRYMSIGLR